MGPCVAGGAYLPALSDIIVMVENTSFMGLGGANLVKGATGQTIDNETLGGARAHTELSGVAHYRVANDEECIAKIREFVSELPATQSRSLAISESMKRRVPQVDLYELIPEDHKQPYDARAVLQCIIDGGISMSFRPIMRRR
jgi:acetyl-CoA carboxylase carboxyltransferase component